MRYQDRFILDKRRSERIIQEFLARKPGYLPEWQPTTQGSDAALIRAFARYFESILQRLNQVPAKYKLAFLDQLGVKLIPARAARAPVVFNLSPDTAETFAESGTQVVAPPPPESDTRLIFETEQRVGLSPGRLAQVFSLWAGRDQYIDHTPAFEAGGSFRLFRKGDLKDTPPPHLYSPRLPAGLRWAGVCSIGL